MVTTNETVTQYTLKKMRKEFKQFTTEYLLNTKENNAENKGQKGFTPHTANTQ